MAKAGTPTKYKPTFCDEVREWGKEGKSIAQIGLELNVAKQTIYNWMGKYPEFLDAMRDAVSFAQAWYEKTGQDALFAERFNAGVWNKVVSCRFRDDYSDSSTQYVKQLESGDKEVPDNKIEEIAKEIAEKYKSEYN